MSMSEVFNELIQKSDLSIQKILNNLIDGTDNVDLKTHINTPKEFTALWMYVGVFKAMKLYKSAKVLENFLLKFERNMISYKRMSRKEIIYAISNLMETEQTNSTIEKITRDKSK